MIIKTLSKEKIIEIVERAENPAHCMMLLYEEVLSPIRWEDCEHIRPWEIHTNRTTSLFILNKMHKAFSKAGDEWPVNAVYLNKGFSSSHDEVGDFMVRITDNAYDLIPKEK